ncbi:hypothetical protein [Streptomyces sp. NPDC017230]|uniref:hypothetical protein n=1 Tax=unclassified Streptomyces TaxID=2593676 RepID=UPI0037A4A613
MADVSSPRFPVPSMRQGDDWRPLSARLRADGTDIPEPLREDCPPFLEDALREWASSAVGNTLTWRRIALRFGLTKHPAGWETTVTIARVSDDWWLEVVDAVLHFMTLGEEPLDEYEIADLNEIFQDAGAAWEVSETADGLQRRVDPTVKQAQARARETAEKAGRLAASERLQKAWVAVYGRHPDPGAAYRHAVAAVEDVACPLFLPRDQAPTLGKVRAHLQQSATKYEMVISDSNGAPASIDAVTALVGLLWHGQRDRHEGGPTSASISQEAAEQAVHVASLLVTTIGGGALRRLP